MIKTPSEIQIMAKAGKILARVMKQLKKEVNPGITTNYLNKVAEDLVLKYGAFCSFKGYKDFPACLCTSVNEEIVHVIPSNRVLKEGDVVCLDLGVFYKGFHSDMAITVGVGKISNEAKQLIKVAKDALDFVIKKVKPGISAGEIGGLIESFIENKGLGVVRELCGHGIGRGIHEDPQIPNYRDKDRSVILEEGMVICLEPMVTMGDWRIKRAKDKYGFQTKDGSLASHFEHTIVITKKGAKILTR